MTGPILVIFPGALGDLICVIPALRALARRHREAALELMARAELVRFATGRLGFDGGRSKTRSPGDSAGSSQSRWRDESSGAAQADSRGQSRGHSIDRREVAHLFAARGASISEDALAFFGAFSHVYSFFAADDEYFRSALRGATGGRASFFPFRPVSAGHVAAAYLREIGVQGEIGQTGKFREGGKEGDIAREGESGQEGGIGQREAAEGGISSELRTDGSPPERVDDTEVALDCSVELYPEDIELAEDRLASLGLEAGNYLLILPGSGSAAKNWPAGNFVTLAKMVAACIRSLVILGPAEVALEAIFADAGLPLVSQIELAEVAGLARLSRCFIGNDSGVSHLAAAAGARGISLFGATDPARWRPLGRGEPTARPLGRGEPSGRQVRVLRREPLDALTEEEVAAAITDLFDARK